MSVDGNLGEKGSKIHQTKMSCIFQTAFQEQCSAKTDKTLENQSQVAYHSVEDILAVESKNEMQLILPRIKFPPASDSEAWCMVDNIISKTLHEEQGNKEYH